VIRVDRLTLLAALLIATVGGFSLIAFNLNMIDLVDWQDIEFGPSTILGTIAILVAAVLIIEGVVKLSYWVSRPNRR
jgi:hypothetical protein